MPFHTEGTRISVSGNLFLNPPGNPDAVSDKYDHYTQDRI